MERIRTIMAADMKQMVSCAAKRFNNSYAYHKGRVDAGFPQMHCYDGYFYCGIMSLYTLKLLKDNGINARINTSSIGYGKYLEDHVCVTTEDGTVIDPTYKQFMRDTRGVSDEYQEEMYVKLPPFFIGERGEILDIYKRMLDLNKKVYEVPSFRMDEVECFWEKPLDETDLFIKKLHLVPEELGVAE